MKKLLMISSVLLCGICFAQIPQNPPSPQSPTQVIPNDNNIRPEDTFIENRNKEEIVKKCENNKTHKLLYTEFDCPKGYTQIQSDWIDETYVSGADPVQSIPNAPTTTP